MINLKHFEGKPLVCQGKFANVRENFRKRGMLTAPLMLTMQTSKTKSFLPVTTCAKMPIIRYGRLCIAGNQ